MRAHKGQASLALLALHALERLHHQVVEVRHGEVRKRPLVRARGHGGALVAERDVLGAVGELLVGAVHLGLKCLQQLQAGAHHGRAGTRQLVVPHREGGTVRLVEAAPAAGGLQQGVALLQCSLVVGAGRGEHRPHGCGEVVQEAPPVRGIALDQGQVLRGEEHRVQRAERLARTDGCRPVDPDPVGACRVELVLEHRALPGPVHAGADHRPFRTGGDQRAVARDPVRSERGRPVHGLHDVGLPHAVGPHEHREPRGQREVEGVVGAEVQEREVVYEHTITGWAVEPA